MLLRLFLALLLFVSSGLYCWPQELKIHFIDVGQGESILVETPKGKAALIDTGNIISGFKAGQYLQNLGIKHLNYIILTHSHLDHIGGIFTIAQSVGFDNIADNGRKLPESDIYEAYERLVRNSGKYKVFSSGDSFQLDQINFKVLWPPSDPGSEGDLNVNSLVIMVKYKNFACLLTGDLTTEAEKVLLEKASGLKADILKIGHHGADDASSSDFLKAVSAKLAIISVSADNRWGYPQPAAIARIKDAGSEILRTDREGTIVFKIDQKGNFSHD